MCVHDLTTWENTHFVCIQVESVQHTHTFVITHENLYRQTHTHKHIRMLDLCICCVVNMDDAVCTRSKRLSSLHFVIAINWLSHLLLNNFSFARLVVFFFICLMKCHCFSLMKLTARHTAAQSIQQNKAMRRQRVYVQAEAEASHGSNLVYCF